MLVADRDEAAARLLATHFFRQGAVGVPDQGGSAMKPAVPRALVVPLLLALGLPACEQARKPALTPVTVQLRWTHQAQFAGLYAADQLGYYAAEGLAVTLLQGGNEVDLLVPVLTGTASFGVAGADTLILGRAKGSPARAIATIYRRSPIVFIARVESGIRRPQDLVGKTVRLSTDTVPTFRAMMARAGISRDRYREVTLPSDLKLFASGQYPLWSAFVDGFALTAQRAGYKLNFIYPDDYGVHLYADTVFTTDEVIAANPDLVRRFLRATLKGWTHAVENAATVGPMVTKYKPDADPGLEVARITVALPLINTGEDHIGWMRPEVWADMATVLREQGVLTAPVDVTQVYTLRFVQEIYAR